MNEIFIPLAICVSIIIVIRALLMLRVHLYSRRIQGHNEEAQRYLTEKVEELRELLDQPSLEVAAIKIEADKVLADMEVHNKNGELNDFITDNREHIEEELKQRAANET